MNLQIELFSTPTVEGRKILSSKGFVCSNVIFGADVIANVYKEKTILPDFVDIEGVEPYHIELFDALEIEVLTKGANAVIDLHIEHSYVHYVDSYYLLISAQGTAVVLEGSDEIPENKNINGKVLEQQILRKQILTKLKKWRATYDERIKENGKVADNFGYVSSYYVCHIFGKEWEYICRYPDSSFAENLHLAYTESSLDVCLEGGNFLHDKIYYYRYFRYFKKLPYEKQIDLAYKYCNQQSSNLIVECDLFDAKQILTRAQNGEYEFATECLKARKKEYSNQDLDDMQNLYAYLVSIPEKGYKSNKGLTEAQEKLVQDFGIKVEALRELLSTNK